MSKASADALLTSCTSTLAGMQKKKNGRISTQFD